MSADNEAPALETIMDGLPGLIAFPGVAIENKERIAQLQSKHSLEPNFILLFERDELWLCKRDGRGHFGRERTALEATALQRRTEGSTELLRACLGAHRSGASAASVRVLDLFAGWGVDALTLSASGAMVTCVERQPALVALLRDASRRVPEAFAQRLQIEHGEARQYLRGLSSDAYAVIYLDPMFPSRKKGALPNKRLQWLAQLTSGPATPETETGAEDATSVEGLVNLALSKTQGQVVLKRRRKDPVAGRPSRQVIGSSVRYDLYTSGD